MWQIATLALYELGGAKQRYDSEDIAVQCHKLSPARFGWKKHRHLPRLDAAAEALNDARRERNGSLIAGSPTEFWTLTAAGAVWAEMHRHLLSAGSAREIATTLRKHEIKALSEVRAHPLFRRWSTGSKAMSQPQVASATLLSASSPAEQVVRQITYLLSLARLGNDQEVEEYLKCLNESLGASL